MLSFTYMTNQNITSVTDLHRGDIALQSAYKIDYHKFLFLELEALKCPSIERYVCWNVSWPASRQSSEELTFSFIKPLFQSLWYVTASGANVLFILLPSVWVVFEIYFAILHKTVAINNVQQSIRLNKQKEEKKFLCFCTTSD